MSIFANAKVNLYLDIVSKRSDGYHNIETIFQEITLCDILDIEVTDSGFQLTCNIPELENDDNLLKKAYDMLKPSFEEEFGVQVHLEKLVPFGAGLGGGSSDCANFMLALKTISGADISDAELVKIGAKLGADVPFFLQGGTAIGRGIGDELEKIPVNFGFPMLLVNPGIHVSTKDAYSGCVLGGGSDKFTKILSGLKSGDVVRVAENLFNGFEQTVFQKFPEIQELRDLIKGSGALGSAMSGSGSTCFGIFENTDSARNAAERISKNKKYFTKVVNSVSR